MATPDEVVRRQHGKTAYDTLPGRHAAADAFVPACSHSDSWGILLNSLGRDV
jgi:hypothetical protein